MIADDDGVYGCLSFDGCWRNLSLTVLSSPEMPEIYSLQREDMDEDDETNLTGDNLDDDYVKPYFTNYSVMHNVIAKLTGSNYTLSCPAEGMFS